VTLTWVDRSSNETGFVIQRRQRTDPFATVGTGPAGATTFHDDAVLPYGTYTYRVAATGSGGQSGWSGELSVATLPAMVFDLAIGEGTFWDFKWSSQATSYGPGASPATCIFRVRLGAPVTLGGRTAHPVHYAGPMADFLRRLAYLASDGTVVSGSADGVVWATLLDPRTSLAIGGGFFRELASNVVYKAQPATFANDLVSGSGVVIGRSVSTTDRVCVDGFGCVSGGAGDVNFTQREFWVPGVGPAGYYELFSIDQGYQNQQTLVKQVGLLASSTRGDQGYFAAEIEPDDSPSGATRSLTISRGVLGSFGSGDAGFVNSATYVNPYGVIMGTATDALQDCYLADVATAPGKSFRLSWDPTICRSCRYSIVTFTAGDPVPIFSTSLTNSDFSTGQLLSFVFDSTISQYGSNLVVCVGASEVRSPGTSPAQIPYALQLE
jgi:hypothetical protein